MIISKTPFRVSFFGGGTDYPQWYRENGGAVLSTTIDKYCTVTARVLPPVFQDIKHRIVWSHIENVLSISEILHPVIREGLKFLGFDDKIGLEIHHMGDLPARSGIGSSSSFVVGFILAMLKLRRAETNNEILVNKAIELEQGVLGENVGSQDIVAASHGGLNFIEFKKTGEISVQRINLSDQILNDIQSRLLLVNTGISRISSHVAKATIRNLRDKKDVLHRMRKLVDRGLTLLSTGNGLDHFGSLLNESWSLKNELNTSVTTGRIESILNLALASGALGGKLLGAGAGGFLLIYVPEERKTKVLNALSNFNCIPFKFESSGAHLLNLNEVRDFPMPSDDVKANRGPLSAWKGGSPVLPSLANL